MTLSPGSRSFQHRSARWSPDGERLSFQSQRGRRKEILPAGTLPTEGGWTTFSITGDGRSIAYLEARREGDIWLADFGEASRTEP